MKDMTNDEFSALCEDTRQKVEEGRARKVENKRFNFKEWATTNEIAPTDPKARAYYRMDTSAKAGGLQKMLKALEMRVKKTTDSGKLAGIVGAMDELIKRLTAVKKIAVRKG